VALSTIRVKNPEKKIIPKLQVSMNYVRVVPELNMWEGWAAASFFFTWVVGFLINKILWVVGDIKIKIPCLVGKLKPTQLICVILPQF
jgi:hypothetical protein